MPSHDWEMLECIVDALPLLERVPNGEACAICNDHYLEAYHLPVEISCGHRFGQECLVEWLEDSNRCPTCGQQLPELIIPSPFHPAYDAYLERMHYLRRKCEYLTSQNDFVAETRNCKERLEALSRRLETDKGPEELRARVDSQNQTLEAVARQFNKARYDEKKALKRMKNFRKMDEQIAEIAIVQQCGPAGMAALVQQYEHARKIRELTAKRALYYGVRLDIGILENMFNSSEA